MRILLSLMICGLQVRFLLHSDLSRQLITKQVIYVDNKQDKSDNSSIVVNNLMYQFCTWCSVSFVFVVL